MGHSKLIAGLLGPVLTAMGSAMLINRELFPAMIGQLANNYGLIFLSGLLLVLAGVAIVRVHNVWVLGWPTIVTLFGWLAIAGGIARMWFPERAVPIAEALGGASIALVFAGVVLLALGAFLCFKAYSPDSSSKLP